MTAADAMRLTCVFDRLSNAEESLAALLLAPRTNDAHRRSPPRGAIDLGQQPPCQSFFVAQYRSLIRGATAGATPIVRQSDRPAVRRVHHRSPCPPARTLRFLESARSFG